MAFDKIKFYQAAALLKSFKNNLPKMYVPMNHVEDYHQYLRELQEQVGIDLNTFRIPSSAIHSERSDPFCDREVFSRQIDAVVLFIDTYLNDLQSKQK